MAKKQLGTGIAASLGMLILILDGKTALGGALKGVELCIRTVIPSLFPFFLLSILVTGVFMGGKLPFAHFLGRLFRIPTGAESILIPAFLGGYPVGAQCIAQAVRAGQLGRDSGERMLAYCSNAGPAFLFGMVASLFPRQGMVWALWIIQILSALLVAQLFSRETGTVTLSPGNSLSLSAAMTSAIRVMASVCGWVVLFRVIIAFLSRWILWLLPAAAQVTVMGLLELSNGCYALNAISDIPLRFLLCCGMLAFGGICVAMQTVSVIGGLSPKYYFLGKLLQTAVSLVLGAAIAYGIWVPAGLISLFFLIIKRKKEKRSSNPAVVGV